MRKAEHMRHICILSLALIVSVSAFFAQALTARAAVSYSYTSLVANNINLKLPVITGFDGTFLSPSLQSNLIYGYDLDYDITANFTADTRYNHGYMNYDCYLYFLVGTNFTQSSLHNFTYTYTDDSPDYIYSVADRPSIIPLNDGFAFHFTLTFLFDNFYNRGLNSFNIGHFHFYFELESSGSNAFTLNIQPYDRNNVMGFTNIAGTVNRSQAPYNYGLSYVIAAAINNSTDINTIISLLTAANTLNTNIFDELTYIYSTNQNIYNRLGAILEFLQEWQLDSDDDMVDILAELERITAINNDIISELPSFSWDEYGENISDYYQLWDQVIRPAAPTGRDTTLVWSWIGGIWPVYIIGMVLILGTISFVLYGKK